MKGKNINRQLLSRLIWGLFLLIFIAFLPACFLQKQPSTSQPLGLNASNATSSNLSLIPFGTYVGNGSSSSSSTGSTLSLILNADGTYSANDSANGQENGSYVVTANKIAFQSSDINVGSYTEAYYYSPNITCLYLGIGAGENTLVLYLRK